MFNVALFISFVTLGKVINLSDLPSPPPRRKGHVIAALCASQDLRINQSLGECPDPEGSAFLIPSPIALPLCFLILFSPLLQERHFRALADLTMPVAATNSESGKKGLRTSVCLGGSESAPGRDLRVESSRGALPQPPPPPTAGILPPSDAPSCHSAFPSGRFYGPTAPAPGSSWRRPWRAEACVLQSRSAYCWRAVAWGQAGW